MIKKIKKKVKKRKINKDTKKYKLKLEKRERNKKDKEWRELVKKRDNSKCVICNRTDIVHCHHIIPREDKEFRFNIDNGICLCPLHHKFSRNISPHKNPFSFMLWMSNNKQYQLDKLSYDYHIII